MEGDVDGFDNDRFSPSGKRKSQEGDEQGGTGISRGANVARSAGFSRQRYNCEGLEAEADEGSFLPLAGKTNTSARGMRSGVAEPREGQYGHDEPEGRRSSGNGCPHEDPSEGMVSCLVWCYAHKGGGRICTVARGITPRNGVNTLFPQFCIRCSGCFGMAALEGSEFWPTNNNIRSKRCQFPWSFPRSLGTRKMARCSGL